MIPRFYAKQQNNLSIAALLESFSWEEKEGLVGFHSMARSLVVLIFFFSLSKPQHVVSPTD
jgi:hypothetical protein